MRDHPAFLFLWSYEYLLINVNDFRGFVKNMGF